MRLGVAAATAALTATAGCSPAATSSSSAPAPGSTITIGIELPLSGADASDGVPTANAVKLAIRDANEGQLVNGFNLVASVKDDTVNGVHDPEKGSSNFAELAADPTVLGVIGPLNSNVAQSLIPISNSDLLALISPANTTPGLTVGPQALSLRQAHPLEITYYRVCPTDDAQGSAGASFAYETLGARRAYVMDDDQMFGRGVADQWAAQFRSEGGTVVAHEHATPGQTDFSAMIARAAAANIDVVFFGGESSTGAAVARKQMAGTPIARVPYLSGDGIQNEQFLDVAGPEAENSYATVAAADAEHLPTAATFINEYRQAYGQDAGAYSASAYVATMVLVEAIADAVHADGGSMPTRSQVLDQLHALTTVNSILGVFAFDQNGDTSLKIVSVWKAHDHAWRFMMQRDFSK